MAPHFEALDKSFFPKFTHSHDGPDAELAHQSASNQARKCHKNIVEVEDEKGKPCTGYPNSYSSEGKPTSQ